jgi:hypothetical protein
MNQNIDFAKDCVPEADTGQDWTLAAVLELAFAGVAAEKSKAGFCVWCGARIIYRHRDGE